MHTTSGEWRLGLALSLITVVLWGALPIALKGLLQYMDSTTITWLRFVIATVILGAYLAYKGKLPKRTKLKGHQVKRLLLITIIGMLGNYILYMFGLSYITPESAQVMIQLAPMLLLIGGLLLFNETFNFKQAIGLVIFLVGLLLFFNQRVDELKNIQGEYTWGVFLVFISALLWAAYALAQKQLLKHFSSQEIMIILYIAGTLIFMPFSEPTATLELDQTGWLLLLFCGVNTLLGYGAFAEALEHWEASRVSATLAITPLITMLFMQLSEFIFPGYIVSEPLNIISIAGAVIVVIGSAMTALSKSTQK